MISILCPCFNEEKSLPLFWERITGVLDGNGEDYEFVFVNDGSTDGTLSVMLRLAGLRVSVRVISLSRNFGKEAALSAAIDYAAGDAVIPIDADLQDPPELIPDMIAKWKEGYDVVLARRTDRKSDSFLKRWTAGCFYRLHNRISHPPLPENVGDFRLMSRRVIDVVKLLPERQRFMKGLFAWVGFDTAVIGYTRAERSAGKSSFNFFRLWKLAVEGITSFSALPLVIWSYLGGLISLAAFLYAGYIALRTLIYGVSVPGYASTLCLILFLGGLQLLGIGVIGEYLSRTYMEAKGRPLYVVADVFGPGGKREESTENPLLR
ncbi:MAG: glycosyltransferase family 2 protein [Synergistaceae bacterium]|jgi:glycosyltransferase involved in cell wall biosynthesis|nr:glycosyltransferase family 2 protein [Synergistaceae bacterium]